MLSLLYNKCVERRGEFALDNNGVV